MVPTLIILLVVLWFFGYVRFDWLPIPDVVLFTINNQQITLWNLLIFGVILWAIGILPRPFREIGLAVFIIWVLATLGIIAIAGLSSILVIAIIVGLILFVLGA